MHITLYLFSFSSQHKTKLLETCSRNVKLCSRINQFFPRQVSLRKTTVKISKIEEFRLTNGTKKNGNKDKTEQND